MVRKALTKSGQASSAADSCSLACRRFSRSGRESSGVPARPLASSFIESRNNGSMRAAAMVAVTPGCSRPMMRNAERVGQVSTL